MMQRLLLIVNKSDDTLSLVDTQTLEQVATVPVGKGPHEVIVTHDGKWAYVANYEGSRDSLSVVDVQDRHEVRRIPTVPYFAPHGMVFSQDGQTLYVTCEQSQAVIELDVATERISRAFKTDQEISHMLVLTPDERKIYTANLRSATATVIDVLKGEAVAHIPTGDGCEGIAISLDHKYVWTTNRAADTLSIIDMATDQVVETLDCPGFPIRVQFMPNGQTALVSCAKANQVAVYDVASRQEKRRIDIGALPVGLLIEPEGTRAYVANTMDDFVSVLDLEDFAIVGRITAGRTPDGMALVL